MMIKRRLFVLGCLFLLPLTSFATFQVAGSPMRLMGTAKNKLVGDVPLNYMSNPKFILTTRPGLLATNVSRFASQHGWTVRWHVKKRYAVNVLSTISGPTFSVTLNRLIAYYPGLKAHYNKYHKTVTIY